MPLVLAGEGRAEARRLQRMAAAGQLRRIYHGIYTDDLVQPLETIVRRELYAICALVAPESIISHRSAFEIRPTTVGTYFLTGKYRREIRRMPQLWTRAQTPETTLSSRESAVHSTRT